MADIEEKHIWGIHAKDEDLFLKDKVIAIGWDNIGSLADIPQTRDAFKARYTKAYPDATKQSIANSAGMLYRFVCEAKPGDYVVFPSRFNREINIGEIVSEYFYDSDAQRYRNRRRVEWLKHLPRTVFSQGALYEIGSAMSFFSIKNYADEYLEALAKGFKAHAVEPDSPDVVAMGADEIIDTTKDFILKNLSRKLKGYDLEGFVASLLNAMGYRTTVSPQGGDRGIDITAYKDELPPRILVQVKSQDGAIKETMIQSLKGAMREGDYGLFVTLSDYSPNAKKYLDSTPIIRGINGVELVDLTLKYYNQLEDKYKRIIPLKMAYIPVPDENGENT